MKAKRGHLAKEKERSHRSRRLTPAFALPNKNAGEKNKAAEVKHNNEENRGIIEGLKC